jgi:hypothetical protein
MAIMVCRFAHQPWLGAWTCYGFIQQAAVRMTWEPADSMLALNADY